MRCTKIIKINLSENTVAAICNFFTYIKVIKGTRLQRKLSVALKLLIAMLGYPTFREIGASCLRVKNRRQKQKS